MVLERRPNRYRLQGHTVVLFAATNTEGYLHRSCSFFLIPSLQVTTWEHPIYSSIIVQYSIHRRGNQNVKPSLHLVLLLSSINRPWQPRFIWRAWSSSPCTRSDWWPWWRRTVRERRSRTRPCALWGLWCSRTWLRPSGFPRCVFIYFYYFYYFFINNTNQISVLI